MKTRTEEIDELLLKLYEWVEVGMSKDDMKKLISEIVKLEIEKHDILKNIS